MEKNKVILLSVIGAVIIIGAIVLNGYNTLVYGQEGIKKTWANVQAQYQRRVDLIGNVVETAKGSAQFERDTLQAVVDARSAWARVQSAPSLDAQVKAANEAAPLVNSALSRLLVTVEAYPQLKSVELFRDVITELEGTENRIAVARRDYNEAVNGYNLTVRQFPSNITAAVLGFTPSEAFKADEGAEKAPKVKFDFNPQ